MANGSTERVSSDVVVDGSTMIGTEIVEAFVLNDTSNAPYAAYVLDLPHNATPPIDRNRGTLIAAYCILFGLGMMGNVWVSFVVGRVFRQSRTEAPKSVQIFILALCVCELTMLTFLLFLICDLIFGQWIVPSRFLCRLYLSSEGMNKFCSPFLLASLSGFCYNRLRGPPTSAHSTSSTRKAVYLVTFSVVSSLLLMTPIYEYGDLYYLVQFNDTHVVSVVTKCAFHPPENVMIAFTAYGFISGYAIPAALFTFFYSAALYSARRQRKRSSCYQNQSKSGASEQQEQQRPVARDGSQRGQSGDPSASGSPYLTRVRTTTFGLVIVYLACWTPYWMMAVWHCATPHEKHGFDSQSTIVLSYFVHMLPYINCAIYPLVYTLLNSHLKKDYKRAKAARKRRRMADRKPNDDLQILSTKVGQKFSQQTLAAPITLTTGGGVDTKTTNRCSLDTTVSRLGLEDSASGCRRSSSCQINTPLDDRHFFARSSLRLTPVLSQLGVTPV